MDNHRTVTFATSVCTGQKEGVFACYSTGRIVARRVNNGPVLPAIGSQKPPAFRRDIKNQGAFRIPGVQASELGVFTLRN